MMGGQQLMGTGNSMCAQQGGMGGPTVVGSQNQMGPPQGQMAPQGPPMMQQMRPQMAYVDGRVIQQSGKFS